MSTISDVARLAGVSAMTVSRVTNNSGYTSRETRERVEAAIAELGYVPNALARQLRSKRTKTLALVVSDISNPFFTTIARGVEDVAVRHGFSVMYCNTDESETEEAQYLLMLIERQVDGVLLVPARSSGSSLRLLKAHGMPVVALDRRVSSRHVDSVRCDSEAAAYALTRHLIELGHRRIAVLTGRRAISTSVDRVAGCRRALEEEGLALGDELVRYGGFNFGKLNQADGHHMATEMLALPNRPTAIFAANNFIAFGVIRALREAGLRVPDDMSVVAFDDLPEEWVSEPFLTVAAQPAYEIGRRAAAILLDRLAGGRAGDGEDVVLPFELILRRSSGPPRVVSGGAGPASSPAVPVDGGRRGGHARVAAPGGAAR
jgi:LacI family transcriptional regulator